MLTYVPNISWLFKELPFGERPRAVAQAGFQALEFGFLGTADLPALLTARDEFGLEIALFNQDIPDFGERVRGYLADPALRDHFKRKLDEALEAAQQLGAHKVMLLAGAVNQEMTAEAQRDCIIENLRYAGPLASDAGVMVTTEPLNPYDFPGCFLTSAREGLDIIKAVNHPAVKFQFDTYHVQRTEGNLMATLVDNMAWIGHIQFGDNPGRAAPGTGEINFPNLIDAIERAGYHGFIGLEYQTDLPGSEALAWVPDERRGKQ